MITTDKFWNFLPVCKSICQVRCWNVLYISKENQNGQPRKKVNARLSRKCKQLYFPATPWSQFFWCQFLFLYRLEIRKLVTEKLGSWCSRKIQLFEVNLKFLGFPFCLRKPWKIIDPETKEIHNILSMILTNLLTYNKITGIVFISYRTGEIYYKFCLQVSQS